MSHKKEKSISLLLAGLFLLAACSAPAAETPTPSPTPEVTPTPVPPPTPTSTPEPTPEPTEEAKEIWGFPIDDTHDAFEVPTGGRLGTVLVTVELAENEKAEFRRELQFAVWAVDDLEKPIQTMTAEWVSAFHWMDIRDANFDGYMDFGYMYAMGNHPAYYHYWIWDEKQGIFVSEPEFDQISVPEFDEETGIISGYSRDGDAGASGTYTFHQWTGGKLVCIRRIRTLAYGTRIRVTVEEPEDGVLTEILRLETDIETAFDEVEKWQDLNYHGE